MPIRDFKLSGLRRTWNTYTGAETVETVERARDLFIGDDNPGDRKTPTPYMYNMYKLDHAAGQVQQYFRANGQYKRDYVVSTEGIIFPTGPRWAPILVDVEGKRRSATSELISQISANDFSASTALGELDETARFGGQLWSSTKDFYRTTHGLLDRANRLGPGKQLRRLSRLAADLWLGYTYAVKPLMNDLAAGYANMTKKPRNRRLFDVRQSQTYSWQNLKGNVGGYKCHVQSKERIVIKHKGYYVADNPWFDEAASSGLFSPITLAWELIPLSFVADWFTGVGNYLESNSKAVDYNYNGSIEDAFTSELVFIHDEYVANDVNDTPFNELYKTEYKWKCSVKTAQFTRKRLTSIPYSTFQPWKGLPFGDAKRVKQLLSGASLLRNLAIEDEKNLFGHENVRYWSERPPLLPRRTGRILPASAWRNLTDPSSGSRD